ncbi:MAG: hypothetical protein LBP76_10965 [Treponema sp.]|jgi:hypothetical protein|nr:hypothetical protein [Treponema sp.]
MEQEIRIKDLANVAEIADAVSSQFICDNQESTKKVSYNVLSGALAKVGPLYDLINIIKDLARTFTGYYSSGDPAGYYNISGFTLASGGSGYAVGDKLKIAGNNTVFTVQAVDGSGVITSLSITEHELQQGDPAGTGISLIGGDGAGAEVDVSGSPLIISVDELWIAGSDDTPPLVFPVTGVKKWDGTAWVDNPDYTPHINDLWANLNNSRGYYWFGGTWNIDDVNADGVTLEVGADGRMRVMIGGIDLQHLSETAHKLINSPFVQSCELISGSLLVKLTGDKSSLRLIEVEGTTILRSADFVYGEGVSSAAMADFDGGKQYYISTQSSGNFDISKTVWKYSAVIGAINTTKDTGEERKVLTAAGLQDGEIEMKEQSLIGGRNIQIDQQQGNIILSLRPDTAPVHTTSETFNTTAGAETSVAVGTFDAVPAKWDVVDDAAGTIAVVKDVVESVVVCVTVDKDISPVFEAPDDNKPYIRKSKAWAEMPDPIVDYDDLIDKPAINGTTLNKDSTAVGLGLDTITAREAAVLLEEARAKLVELSKANIYVRLAQGITIGNNIQGMHVMPKEPFAYYNDWEIAAADGGRFTRTDNSLVYTKADSTVVTLVEDGEVKIADYRIDEEFHIESMTGSFTNVNLFYRHFDIKDLDQRIGLVSALLTVDKSSVVNAINSLKQYVDGILGSSEVSGSPYVSYAAFVADAGATITPSKYAYVTFTDTDTWPSGGKWDEIVAGETWRLDCSDTQWLPTSNMTAAMTANVLDQAATNALKQAGNDTVVAWLQSFRNNLKSIFDSLQGLGRADTINGIAPGADGDIKETIVVDTYEEMVALAPTLPENTRVNVLQGGSDNVFPHVVPDVANEGPNLLPSVAPNFPVSVISPGNGYIRIYGGVDVGEMDKDLFVNRNGKRVTTSNTQRPSARLGIDATFPVEKDDVITIEITPSSTMSGKYFAVYFIPPKITFIPTPRYSVEVGTDYSLEEQPLYKMDPVTKEITPLLWIDGKQMYKKVIQKTIPAGTTVIEANANPPNPSDPGYVSLSAELPSSLTIVSFESFSPGQGFIAIDGIPLGMPDSNGVITRFIGLGVGLRGLYVAKYGASGTTSYDANVTAVVTYVKD